MFFLLAKRNIFYNTLFNRAIQFDEIVNFYKNTPFIYIVYKRTVRLLIDVHIFVISGRNNVELQ